MTILFVYHELILLVGWELTNQQTYGDNTLPASAMQQQQGEGGR